MARWSINRRSCCVGLVARRRCAITYWSRSALRQITADISDGYLCILIELMLKRTKRHRSGLEEKDCPIAAHPQAADRQSQIVNWCLGMKLRTSRLQMLGAVLSLIPS